MTDGDAKWAPRHFPELPARVQANEQAVEAVEAEMERARKVLGRLHLAGWVIAAELALLIAQGML